MRGQKRDVHFCSALLSAFDCVLRSFQTYREVVKTRTGERRCGRSGQGWRREERKSVVSQARRASSPLPLPMQGLGAPGGHRPFILRTTEATGQEGQFSLSLAFHLCYLSPTQPCHHNPAILSPSALFLVAKALSSSLGVPHSFLSRETGVSRRDRLDPHETGIP